ncbi:MAG TPA: hypothetical protein PK082_05155 [Phycisphaerae bacterium]|nr:hypothetical protein [Phycisphaerae bacterium]
MKRGNLLRICTAAVLGVLAGFALAYGLYRNDIRSAGIRKKIDSASGLKRAYALHEQKGHLAAGMSKEQVAFIMGLPDNADPRYVWMWGQNRQSAQGKRWREIWRQPFLAYLLFDEQGRLLWPEFVKPDPPEELYTRLHEGPPDENVLRQLKMPEE